MIAEFLIILCILLSLKLLFAKNMILAIVYLAVLNLCVAIIFYLMKAPDLAVTQAAINAALTTIVFIYTVRRCGL